MEALSVIITDYRPDIETAKAPAAGALIKRDDHLYN
jgi:hypothetical protein